MLGIDTYRELLALIGCVFLIWFLVVALFAPHIPYKLSSRLDCTSTEFADSLRSATLSTVHADSCIEILTNANEFYPAMLDAIRAAQRTINLECYIFRPDRIGRLFMEALMERARGGVTVTMVVDSIGSFSFGRSAIREMRSAGCRVELYQRLK